MAAAAAGRGVAAAGRGVATVGTGIATVDMGAVGPEPLAVARAEEVANGAPETIFAEIKPAP